MRYTITKELQAKHGLKARNVREPTDVAEKRAASALRAARLREVKDGTWKPATEGGASGPLVETYGEQWIANREKSGVITFCDEAQRLRTYVFPVIGKKALGAVQRPEVVVLMAKIQSEPSKHTLKPHAPRNIHRIYEALRTMYSTAVLDGVVLASPCTLRIRRGELPPKKDKNPRWRALAIFTRDEVEQLISDERVPLQRRVYYAIAFLAGVRLGEVSGRRFRDYDDQAHPLGQLLVATQYDDKDLKGDRPSREVPVHPTLAKILAEWRLNGFALVYGRHPKPDDFIVPKRAIGRNGGGNLKGMTPGAQRQQNVWANFQVDLEKLGLRRRRVHDTRRTFISLSKADGADKYLMRWVTHGPRKDDAWDDYNSPPWDALCEQVAKLKIGLRGRAAVVSIGRKSKRRGGT
jgi:integrase